MKEIKKQHQNLPTKPKVKYVKKAGQWCKTTFKNGEQIIEWFSEKPK